MNLRVRTMGGHVWWDLVAARGAYRLQRNRLTGHFRILDASLDRVWWDTGTHADAIGALNELATGGRALRNPVEHLAQSLATPIREAAEEVVSSTVDRVDVLRAGIVQQDIPAAIKAVESVLDDDRALARRLDQVGKSAWSSAVMLLFAQLVVGGVAVLLVQTGGDPGVWAATRVGYGLIGLVVALLAGWRVWAKLRSAIWWTSTRLGSAARDRAVAFGLDAVLRVVPAVLVAVAASVGLFVLAGRLVR